MKQKLVKCASRVYSELIRSDIPGSSSVRSTQLHFLRSSPLSAMNPSIPKSSSPSVLEPLIVKPTRGELRSHLEVLAKKKRSVKRKPPSSLEGCPPARGNILKVGASSLPLLSVGAGGSSGRVNDPPLEVLPISVWSPTSRGVAPPPTMLDEVTVNHDRFEVVGIRSLFFLMWSSLPRLFPLSSVTPTSGEWVPCPSRRL